MQILCSSEFIQNLNLLTKPKYSGTYGTLKTEIDTFFKEHDTFDKVLSENFMLRDAKFVRLNKIRLDNPLQNSGKSGGFRMIIICDRRTNDVGLICVYPKRGQHGMENTPDDLLKKWVKAYTNDKASGRLKNYKDLV